MEQIKPMAERESQASSVQHPIELVSRFVMQHDWYVRQTARNAILADIPGEWSHYQLSVTWQDEAEALVVNCHMDLPFQEENRNALLQVVGALNQELWLGHFVYDLALDRLSLRHTLPLRGAGGATPEQIEDVVDIMLGECELAYPVLYQVAIGEIATDDAAKLTLIAHQGVA
ncbi:MAG: YbjN domain-containing protein [Candidatus Puniceispirillaceae bacterium]